MFARARDGTAHGVKVKANVYRNFRRQRDNGENSGEEATGSSYYHTSGVSPVDQLRDRMRDYEWQNAPSKSHHRELPITRCQSQRVPCLKTDGRIYDAISRHNKNEKTTERERERSLRYVSAKIQHMVIRRRQVAIVSRARDTTFQN